MRSRAFRRHQTYRHMWRRLKEDRNQHYNDLSCPCWSDKKAMAKFKEQPKQDCWCCKNPRRNDGWPADSKLTIQERKFLCNE
jgi:hypothetical protein